MPLFSKPFVLAMVCCAALCAALAARPAEAFAAAKTQTIYGYSVRHKKDFSGTIRGNPLHEDAEVVYTIPGINLRCEGTALLRTLKRGAGIEGSDQVSGLMKCNSDSTPVFILECADDGEACVGTVMGVAGHTLEAFVFGAGTEAESRQVLAPFRKKAEEISAAENTPAPEGTYSTTKVYAWSDKSHVPLYGGLVITPAQDELSVVLYAAPNDRRCFGTLERSPKEGGKFGPLEYQGRGYLYCGDKAVPMNWHKMEGGFGLLVGPDMDLYVSYGFEKDDAIEVLGAFIRKLNPNTRFPKGMDKLPAAPGKAPVTAQAPAAKSPPARKAPAAPAAKPFSSDKVFAYSDKSKTYMGGKVMIAPDYASGEVMLYAVEGGSLQCSGTVKKSLDFSRDAQGKGFLGRGSLKCNDGSEPTMQWYLETHQTGTIVAGYPDKGFLYLVYGMEEERAAEVVVALIAKLNPQSPLLAEAGASGRGEAGKAGGREAPAASPDKAGAAGGKEEAPKERGGGMGTGFFVSDNGVLVTNWHVVEDAKAVSVYLPGLRRTVPAAIVDADPINDIAVLKAEVTGKGLPLCLSGVAKGEEVAALGYPAVQLQGVEMKATFGRINALSGLMGDRRFYQIDTPIQPGNSGGPLLNRRGEVVGVVTQTINQSAALEEMGTLAQNVNYAVKADYVNVLLRSLPEFTPPAALIGKTPAKPSPLKAILGTPPSNNVSPEVDMPTLVKAAEPSVVIILAE